MPNKDSCGLDGISQRAIKAGVYSLIIPLTWVINTSILTSTFPTTWKAAKITAIYKGKGSKKDKSNYRPISNLKACSKVLEAVIESQLRSAEIP